MLNKKQLLHQNLYFGKRQAMGSKRKVLQLHGIGAAPHGDKMTFAMQGSGAFLHGEGSLLRKIKQLSHPLLKLGRKIAVDAAMSQLGRIKQPELRGLAKKGLEAADRGAIEQALSGQDKLGNLAGLATRGLEAAEPELLRLAQKGVRRGLAGRRGRGVGGRALAHPMMDEVANVTDRSLKKDGTQHTQDNRQLTLLKDVIRSKPIKTRTNRTVGGAAVTF